MICQILNLLQKTDQLSCDLVILVKKGYLMLSWRPFREKTTFLREDSGRPSKLQHWTGTLVSSSSLSTVTTCHCINHVTKRPTPSLDKDSVMESKACVANKFSILGFETSFTLNWSYIFSVNFCYKVRTVFFFRSGFKEKHFVSTKGKQEYYCVSFKTFYLRIVSVWIVPRYLDVWTIHVYITFVQSFIASNFLIFRFYHSMTYPFCCKCQCPQTNFPFTLYLIHLVALKTIQPNSPPSTPLGTLS